MAQPKGLKWSDRIAVDDGTRRAYFDCHRGHKALRRVFQKQTDAKAFRTEHDAEAHSRLGKRMAFRRTTLLFLFDEYLEHLRLLVVRGAKSRKTLWYYGQHFRNLKRGFGPSKDPILIGNPEIARFIARRFEEKITEGAAIVKDLKALRTAMAWKFGKASLSWSIPVDDIQPKVRTRHEYSREELTRFLAALRGAARLIVLLKLRTGLRNVEIESLRAGDVDLERRALVILLRAKRKRSTIPHAFPLTDDLMGVLRPEVEGREAGELVFRGRQIRGFRDDFLEASATAKLKVPIASIGQLRHHVLTWLANSFGTALTARAVGHKTEQTTAGYLLNDGDLEVKRKLAEAVAGIVPLQGTSGGTVELENVGISETEAVTEPTAVVVVSH